MRKLLIAAPIVAVLLFVAAGAGWYFLIRSDASPLTDPLPIPSSLLNTTLAPTIAAGTTAATATAASSNGEALKILSDQSEADYYVGETLASLGVPSTANGKTKAISGTFYLTGDGTALDTTQTSQFTVDVTTLKSDQSRRDARAQNALETSRFPTATFTAESATGYDPSIPANQQQTLQLTGTLEIHGVQKEVTWELKITRQANVISALATLDFKFSDFGVTPPSLGGFVSVQDHGTLQAQIIAQQQ
ncbi:MAG: YceI family protein [Chloroflexota bacterium]|nr:YceI family protein [Chloroflexota bacterium]